MCTVMIVVMAEEVKIWCVLKITAMMCHDLNYTARLKVGVKGVIV